MLSEFQLVLRDLEQNVNYCATLTAFSALQKVSVHYPLLV